MVEIYIVDACRTPMGKIRGQLAEVRPDDLAAHAVSGLLARNPSLPLAQIEDIHWGAANQAGEDNRNVARMAGLLAGLPVEVPGTTVNRLCGSGMQAVISGSQALAGGWGDLIVAGGSESMSRAPLVTLKPETEVDHTPVDTVLGWRMVNPEMQRRYPPISLGLTAERVAEKYQVSRIEQDEFAFNSHLKAVEAMDRRRFDGEIVPIEVGDTTIHQDQGPRSDTSLEKLASLRPVFQEEGTVTAGNSSPMNDGAAALLLATEAGVERFGLKPLARIVSSAAAGVHPDYMGIGPVPASTKALQRAGISVSDLDRIELNEAFAAQALACMRQLDLDPSRVNVNGGAIALGHPLGASGARILVTLAHELARSGGRYGLATMCIGVGQGIATVIESV